MPRYLKLTLLCGTALLAFAGSASAKMLDLDGTFRFRGVYMNNLDIEANNNDETRFNTFRFKLLPTLTLSESVALHSRVDIFDNVVWGLNDGTGNVATGSVVSQNDKYSSIGTSNQADMTSTNAIRLKKMWAEFTTPVGKLEVGRMGSHWGLGMFSNDGERPDDNGGDVVDRIKFTTSLFGFYVVPMIEKVVEGPVNMNGHTSSDPATGGSDAEVDGYNLAIVKKFSEDKVVGLLLVDRFQGASATNIISGDIFAKWDLGEGFSIDFEAALNNGSTNPLSLLDQSTLNSLMATQGAGPHDVAVQQFGGLLRLAWKAEPLTLSLEEGYASGPDATDDFSLNRSSSRYAAFSFHKEYGVDQILFKNILGSFSNAMYTKLGALATYEDFDFGGSIIYSSLANDVYSASASVANQYVRKTYTKDLGFEIDLNGGLKLGKHVRFELLGGAFVPSSGLIDLKGSGSSSTAYTVQAKLFVNL